MAATIRWPRRKTDRQAWGARHGFPDTEVQTNRTHPHTPPKNCWCGVPTGELVSEPGPRPRVPRNNVALVMTTPARKSARFTHHALCYLLVDSHTHYMGVGVDGEFPESPRFSFSAETAVLPRRCSVLPQSTSFRRCWLAPIRKDRVSQSASANVPNSIFCLKFSIPLQESQ